MCASGVCGGGRGGAGALEGEPPLQPKSARSATPSTPAWRMRARPLRIRRGHVGLGYPKSHLGPFLIRRFRTPEQITELGIRDRRREPILPPCKARGIDQKALPITQAIFTCSLEPHSRFLESC